MSQHRGSLTHPQTVTQRTNTQNIPKRTPHPAAVLLIAAVTLATAVAFAPLAAVAALPLLCAATAHHCIAIVRTAGSPLLVDAKFTRRCTCQRDPRCLEH